MGLFAKKTLILALLVIALALLGVNIAAQDAVLPAEGTEILWDKWGVPHIYAPDNESLFYAFGWAQMHNHADLVLQLYGRARGEAAAYWGADFVQSDVLIHTLGVPATAQLFYDNQEPEFRVLVDAMVAGMNAYAAANPDAIDPAMQRALPVRNTDPIALAYYDLTILFVGGSGIGQAGAWSAAEMGSNAIAIAPERSASGNALAILNPHLDWSDVFVWFEAHWITPDLNMYGATLVGLPGLEIGFNSFLGWTHTVNTFDGVDLYELTLTESGGYLLDGAEQQFTVSMDSIAVLQADGSTAAMEFPVVMSQHGPVVAQREDGKALAFRVVNDSQDAMYQWWRMANADNFEEFEDAMRMVAIPMFNTVYADVDGHIYYLFNAQIPVRGTGDFNQWLGIQPGDDSSLIWTELHTYDDLPKVLDPPTGWLSNANEPPWTSTIPPVLNIADYPPYFAPQDYYQPGHIFRPQASQQVAALDDSVTFEELVAAKHDTHMEIAEHMLDDLIAAAMASDSAIAQEAAGVLAAWDRRTDASSRGAVLFIRCMEILLNEQGMGMFAVPFDIEQPFTTPSGLADPDSAVAALEAAAMSMLDEGLALDVPFGSVYRLRLGDYDLPGNGYSDPFGVFRAAWYAPAGDGTYTAQGGDSWYVVVEFSSPPRARVLVSQGNATQPGSPHVGDQLLLFSAQEMRAALLTRDAIEANLELHTTFE